MVVFHVLKGNVLLEVYCVAIPAPAERAYTHANGHAYALTCLFHHHHHHHHVKRMDVVGAGSSNRNILAKTSS